MPMIRVDELAKTFPGGVRALSGVNLSIELGEGVVLLGANGSGKSTLLRCLVGFERPTSGMVQVDGVEITSVSQRSRALRKVRSRVGMVFQRFGLVPGLSAWSNVMLGALGRTRLYRLTPLTARGEDRREAMACLDRVGLAHVANQRTETLSGGQQQRVAIARMLMQRPTIVLADEPIASLDPRAGREVMDLLWGIADERRLTVVCTLHQLDVALAYGQRIVGLQRGEKVLDRPRAGLVADDLRTLYTSDSHDAQTRPSPIERTPQPPQPMLAAASH